MSIQERLQLKRVPMDTWNTREQLCLASAVVRSGDQNWMSVSRALKTVGEANRPPDWYSQKSCAAQYGALLEHVETPKRKKRSSEGAVETPQESILKKLTQERIVEIQKTVAEMNQQYDLLKNEIQEVRNTATSEERLREMWAEIEVAKRARERETARRTAWLREREERRARADRTWRPSTGSPAPHAVCAAAPASPLLTSLLKSSPVVTTPQHISHPANVVETVSPSAGAPTLSMLLEKAGGVVGGVGAVGGSVGGVGAVGGGVGGVGGQHDNKHAAIEHIKNQLVQIEQQLKASASSPPALAPSVDIDDIEIKAEDVYAFRDVDIHIQPVAAMHKPVARAPEKQEYKKDDTEIPVAPEISGPIIDEIKEEPMVTEPVAEEMLPVDVETANEPPKEEPAAEEVEVVGNGKVTFPEVKFPTPEIKVIQADEEKIKEEVKEPEMPAVIPEEKPEVEVNVEETPAVESEPPPPSLALPVEVPATEYVPEQPPATEADVTEQPDPQMIPLPPEPSAEAVEDQLAEIPPPPPEPELPKEEVSEEQQRTEDLEGAEVEVTSAEETVEEDIKKDEDAEDSIPLKEIAQEAAHSAPQEAEVKEQRPPEPEERHTETDDDTPMELSREEEKDGKKKRDYSRKKKPDSRTCSGSESAEASAPDSPSNSDAERQHRLWKKSVMLVYSRLCAHKYASIFLRPISDEEAPGYSMVVKRPMDLTTVRRHIEAGVVRTTAEFQRDVLLMLSNALMYNSSEHSVYTMAREMHEEAISQLSILVAAQAHAGLVAAPPARRKRRRPDSPPHHAKRHH